MATAVLKFNLEEDESAFRAALNGMDYKIALWNIDQMLRSHVKHGDYPPGVKDAYQEVRDFLHAELNERGLTLD